MGAAAGPPTGEVRPPTGEIRPPTGEIRPDSSDHRDTPRRPAHLNRGATALIGTLLALLGFALAVQLRSNSSGDALAGARQDDLVRILDDESSRLDRLEQQFNTLQTAKQRLTDTGSNAAAARSEAQRQADALAILTGTIPAHGEGVTVSISDPKHLLKAEDLLDVVEELRGAGAEVIQFGGVRVSTASAFTDDAGGVFLDGTSLSAPYQVLAIGEPTTLNTALNISGGVVSTVQQAGGTVSVVQKSRVDITATRPVNAPKYATQVGK